MSAKKKRLIMKQIKKQQREANSMEGTLYAFDPMYGI